MRVTVSAGSWARRWLPQTTVELELPESAVVEDVLELICIPSEEVGLFSINGKAVPQETALLEGDAIRVFPLVMGG